MAANAFAFGDLAHLGVAAEHELQASGEALVERLLSELCGVGIAVDGEHACSRAASRRPRV